MGTLSLDELKSRVSRTADTYNENANADAQITRIELFGSYANGLACEASDVDLLVSFRSAVVSLFTLAKVLSTMEESLGVSVDVVQELLPEGSLLVIERKIPLYERF